MKPIIALLAAGAAALLIAPASAQQKLTAPQERMKSCNAEASSHQLKGEKREEFMSGCLKREQGDRKLTAQQEKMVTCNREAGGKQLKGKERRAFIGNCLRAERPPSSAAGASK